MAAIFGVLLLCIDEVLAEDTSEDDIECTDGVGSFLLLELLILNYFYLFIFHMIPKKRRWSVRTVGQCLTVMVSRQTTKQMRAEDSEWPDEYTCV